MTDTFSRNVFISLGGHALVLALIMVRAVFVPTDPIEIRRAIRVDVVDLPRKMTETTLSPPPKAAEPAVKPVKETAPSKPAEPPKPETVNLAKPDPKAKKPDTAKRQKQALAQIKAMTALDKIKQDVSKEKEAKPSTVVAGNQVSAGNSLSGLDKIEYDRYFDELENKIRAQWSIPQWLADSPYKAQVQVLIDERGYVIKKIMRRSSGNEVFDSKVIEAIEGSSPLPVPPQRLHGMLSTSGIILNFPE